MRTLYDETFTGLDITSEKVLAEFTVTDQNVALITMVNVDNISGVGGEYSARLYIDDRIVVPDRKVFCDPGATSVSFQSRDIVVYIDGVLSIKLKGLGGDNNVSGRLILIDSSPVTVEEVSDIVMSLVPDINQAIQDNMDKINITVKPETRVLGACSRPVVAMPKVRKC
jgi:hypothetical protein